MLIGSSPRAPAPLRGGAGPRVVGADGRTVRFEGGERVEVDVVIWATGYRPDFSWIDLPFDAAGRFATGEA